MNTVSSIRVRFAPSPTGHLHIGGLRTAFFNWLFARHNKGTFLLRIEDTDIERSKPEFLYSIFEALEWANIISDEPNLIQTHSIDIHKKLINKLLEQNKAYRCYCPADSSDSTLYTKYDGRCRTRNDHPQASYVVRIKIPIDQEKIEFNDLVYGPISFPINQFDDFIIARSDGTPIYNFVVVADDAAMKITHVIRGDDHIANTPKQIFIYEALGYKVPLFAHLPLILGPSGTPLSKRDAATSVLDYKKNGYLAHALCNYLVRLGWSHGDQELFSIDELINHFTLEGVGKKGAIFDVKKLDWMNGIYMRQTDNQELITLIQRDVDHNFFSNVSDWSHDQLLLLLGLYKERVSTLKQLCEELYHLYSHDRKVQAQDINTIIKPMTVDLLKATLKALEDSSDFSPEAIKNCIKTVSKETQSVLPDIAQPLRLALTGTLSSPGIFELLSYLGKAEALKRIRNFMDEITQ